MKGWVRLQMIARMLPCCKSPKSPPTTILVAQSGTSTKAAPFMAEGDRLVQAKDWACACQAYQSAIEVQPDLAEAHYNLVVILELMSNRDEAKKHDVTGANLASENKVILTSPLLRESGLNYNLRQKSYLDLTPGRVFDYARASLV